MTLEISKRKFIDYTLVYLLMGISGMPIFYGDMLLFAFLCLAFLVFLLRKEGFHRFYFFIFFTFLVLVVLQGLRFNYLPYSTMFGMLIKISAGYFVIATVKEKFTNYYVNIICVLSVLSFLFFIPLFFSMSFESIFRSIAVTAVNDGQGRGSLILYHLNFDRPEGLYRNCGPFWEPAAFGGYLLIAFMFNLARTNTIKDKRSIILLITLISTFSTTVFIVLGMVMFFYIFLNQKLAVKLILVPMFTIGFVVAFYQVEFLHDKIMEEIEKGDKQEEMRVRASENGSTGHSRLSSAIADYKDFIKYPIIGRGLYETTFFDPTDFKARHNGVSKVIAQFGIIGSLIYFMAMFRSFKKLVLYSRLHAMMRYVFFGVIIMIGIAEVYFAQPFFWALIFLHLVIHDEVDVIEMQPEKEKVAVV